MLKIGIIGAGTFAYKQARAIEHVDGLKLVAASRRSQPELQSFSKQFGLTGYSGYSSMLSNNEIDAVLISTPHDSHASIAIEAAKAGKHILIEKPFTTNLAEADDVIAAADKANVKLMVGHNMQFVPASIKAKELLESNEVGRVVMAHGSMCKLWMDEGRKNWHLSRYASGGLLLTAGIHYIDLLTFLIDSKVRSVFARISTKFHQQESDDCSMLMLEYENGAVVNIQSVGYRQGVRKMDAELFCTEGVLRVDNRSGVFVGTGEEWQLASGSASDNWMQNSLVAQWTEFRNSILEDRSPQVNGSYARHVMEVIFAAFESSSSGRCVTIQ